MPRSSIPTPPKRLRGTGQIRWLETRQAYIAEISEGTAKRYSKSFAIAQYPTPRKALEAAETWLAEQARLKRQGAFPSASEITLEQFGRDYTDRRKPEWKPKHHQIFTAFLERFAYPFLGQMKLTELTPVVIQRWTDQIRNQPTGKTQTITTPYMAYKALFYLRLLLNQAVELELIHRNPASKVKLPRPAKQTLTRWSPSEVQAVMAWLKAQQHWLEPYVHIALTTGMRREELLGLTWKRVNLAERYLDVQEVVTYVNGHWSFDERPKTARAARRIYFDPGTAAMFRRQQQHVCEMRSLVKQWTDMGLVFPSKWGTPLAEKTLYTAWDEMCEGAKVTRIRPYDTRSTWSTLSKGKLPEHVAVARAGHSQAVREEHYIRSLDEEQQAAALGLEELIRSQSVRKTGPKRAKTGG